MPTSRKSHLAISKMQTEEISVRQIQRQRTSHKPFLCQGIQTYHAFYQRIVTIYLGMQPPCRQIGHTVDIR